MKNKIANTLGLAMRAGKIVTGDELNDAIKKNKVDLVFIGNNASARTQEDLQKLCGYRDIPVLMILTKEEISASIGKFNRVALGIKDPGFSQLIKSYLTDKR